MTRDDDETQTSAPPTVVDPAVDPALDATIPADEGSAPPNQIVIHTGMDGLPSPGERVGRYELGQVIGRGGMGVVYKARDPELDRPLAIKVVLPATAGKRSQQRLLDEARAMAKLRHPAVVPVFDVGTTDRGVYVVMPLLAGGTLDEWTKAARRSWREVLARYITAGRGLAAAHDAGLVHRDFKPHNILLGERGEVMVGDFGLAADTLTPNPTRKSAPESIEGTPAYMAPEHAAGEPVDARADQYSFCVSLWEGLHGERPTEAATRQGGVLSSPLPAVPADRRGAPGWLLSAIGRGWESSPDRRWPSMTALLDHIERRLRLPRRIFLGAAAAGVISTAAAIVVLAPAQQDASCPDPRARMATAWSPEIRARIEAAFTATGLPYAPETLRRILPVLDRYAIDWRMKHIEVCRAGTVEKTQSSELLDRRMACLDRRFAALTARTTAFASASRSIVEGAVAQAENLPALADCDNTERLLAFPMPSAPETRSRIAEIERQLDDIDALIARGEGKDAIERLNLLLPAVRDLGFPPAHDRLLAQLVTVRGDDAANEAALRERVDAAARAQDDHSLAVAWALLAHHLLNTTERRSEVEAILPVIQAAVVRAGSPPDLVAHSRQVLASWASLKGDNDEAIRLIRELLEASTTNMERARNAHNLASILMNAGRPKEAIPLAEESVALIADVLGGQHPATASYTFRLAQILLRTGDANRAASLLKQVSERQRAALGDHPDLAKTLVTIANLARARGETGTGRRAIEEAIDIFERVGHRGALAGSLATLAEFVRETDGLDAARPHYERSLNILAETMGKDSPSYAMTEANLASALANAGRCDEAEALYAHAIEALERTKDARYGMMLGASAICDRDNPARAVAAIAKYQAAVAACTKHGCPPDLSLSFRFGLGASLHLTSRGRSRGLALIRETRAAALAAGVQPVVNDIDEWAHKQRIGL